MRLGRLTLGAIAVWLGVIALGLDALVPVHVAFDLAHAIETADRHKSTSAGEHDPEWRLLALVTGHADAADRDADGRSDGHDGHRRHHHVDCAVCSALGTLAGFAAADAAKFPVPVTVEASTVLAALDTEPPAAPAAAYHSRAPPNTSAEPTA